MPYVYLVQPVELVGTNRYKVGMSRLNNLSRLRSYKVGTRYISMFDCDDARLVERSLIAAFNKDFNRIGGNEYFEVPEESKAIQLFVAIVMNNRCTPEVQVADDPELVPDIPQLVPDIPEVTVSMNHSELEELNDHAAAFNWARALHKQYQISARDLGAALLKPAHTRADTVEELITKRTVTKTENVQRCELLVKLSARKHEEVKSPNSPASDSDSSHRRARISSREEAINRVNNNVASPTREESNHQAEENKIRQTEVEQHDKNPLPALTDWMNAFAYSRRE